MRSEDWIALEDRFGAHNYAPLPVVLTHGSGVWVHDVDGNRYLDGLSAYSALNHGHCHPRIVARLREQAERLTLTSRAFHNDQLGPFAQELCELLGYERMLPMNSGAEAVETAIKVARKWGYARKQIPRDEAEILAFRGNFHGRTTTIVGFSSEAQYRDGFGPFAPGFRLLPFGDAAAVRAAMHPRIAAILFEPIQGEAGVVIPPAGFLRELRAIASEHGALLIADEIQSGLGRAGELLASSHEQVRPDVVILGKALGGGCIPVSAVLADDDVLGVLRPGDHGSTFGGNPLACAVAREALRVLVDERLCERSRELGGYALGRLAPLRADPRIRDVRGRGLWIGIELQPSAGGAKQFCIELMRAGLLVKDTHAHVIRFAPPLVITREELDFALARLLAVFNL